MSEVQDVLDENPELEERLDLTERGLRRIYMREHPLAICLSLAAIVVGALLILVPAFADAPTGALSYLPNWAPYGWALSFLIGGVASLRGFLTYDRKAEVVGSSLQSSAYLVTFLAVLVARGLEGSLAGFYLLFLSIGFFLRAYFVLRDSQ